MAGCSNDAGKVEENEEQVESLSEETGEEQLDEEQKFVYSSASEITGLNPLLNTTGPDNGLHSIVLETLVAKVADEEGKQIIKPAAAEDWTISEDGLVYTFNIREDAVWSDGVPVTAHDFVYTFRQMATPEVGSTNAWLFDGVIENFTEALYEGTKSPEEIGVRAIDDKTVEFTLVKPYGYFLELLDGAKPIRQDKWEEWGGEYGSSIDKAIFNGPFIVKEWQPNVQMTLVKNENYWDAENVKLQKIERKVIKDTATAAQALLNGEIDVLSTNDADWKGVISEDDRFNLITQPGNAPEFLGFNCANKYFKNPKIRLAFSLAIDREKYNQDLENGESIPLYSLMPPITNVGDELYSERVNGENEIIKELMEKYPDPKELLIEGLKEEGFDPDPSKMEVRLATRGTGEYSKKAAEWFLQEWEEKLGVRITIDMMEWNIMWDKVDQGDYDICTSGWGPYYNDPNALLEIYHPTDGYFNSTKSGWTGPDAEKFAELLEQASLSPDNKERAELLLEAEKILVGTGVIAPTYVGTANTFLAKYVKGFYTNPHAQIDYTKIYTVGRP
ncbi:MAG: peptide ABC transporter substrate-binding protein [Tissierellia bacterium]|nr:peptide ABC transporter substrate-binding protein [Tissierellia bacterium]